MYLVTNRNLIKSKKGGPAFGDDFNAKGPDELRIAEVTGTPDNWHMTVMEEAKNARRAPSEELFRQLQNRMGKRKRNCLFFVHGFNNPLKDVVVRGLQFEQTYNVEVIAFSWPADRGIRGLTNYRHQKHEARLSVNALDRCLEKLAGYMQKYHRTDCKQSFNLMLHSMGNYLLKNLLSSSVYQGETLLFDNVILVAADANNEGHEEWVDRMAHRRRIYITINENDQALLASRMKYGDQQKARLGQFTKNLNSRNAVYLDFTDAKKVDDSHAYFEGEPLENTAVKNAFHQMINGQRVEEGLSYDPHSRIYRIP